MSDCRPERLALLQTQTEANIRQVVFATSFVCAGIRTLYPDFSNALLRCQIVDHTSQISLRKMELFAFFHSDNPHDLFVEPWL